MSKHSEHALDIKAIRERLVRRREELRSRAGRASADLRRENEPLSADFADQATQRENDDVLGAISATADSEIQQLNHALRRLDEGLYTTCASCGEPIEPGRLEVVPYADRCRSCADGAPGRSRSG